MAASLLSPRTARASSSRPAREQQTQAELGQQLDGGVDGDPADDLRAEHDSAGEQQDDLGHPDAEQTDQQRDEGGDRGDHHERAELLGHVRSPRGAG
jgi:hypothetical protein